MVEVSDLAVDVPPECPTCSREYLRAGAMKIGEEICERCSGSYVTGPGMQTLMSGHFNMTPDGLRSIIEAGAPTRAPCPTCNIEFIQVRVRGQLVYVCGSCSGAWFEAGQLYSLTAGKYGQAKSNLPSPARAPLPSARRKRRVHSAGGPTPPERARTRWLRFGVVGLLVVGGATAFELLGDRAALRQYMPFLQAAPSAAASSKAAPGAALPGLPAPQSTEQLLADYVFGGRPIAWWKAELQSAHPTGTAPDEKRLALLTRRAQSLGMVVKNTPEAVQVDFSQTLVDAIGKKLAQP